MKYVSSIISCNLGNILEWYDFGLFAIFSSLFSRLFFPVSDPELALIATVGIFSIGFLCRPIGALIFGYLGDKLGRAKTLRLSILMIVLPTLLIGFLPTYEHIGIAAPILLTFIRMWQGISIGGEYSGSLIYLAEMAPNHRRAVFTSLANMGANFGILLATLVGMIVSDFIPSPLLEDWGWRIAYLVSGLISILIYIFRLQIHETGVFSVLKQTHQLVKNPIKMVVTKNLFHLCRTVGMVCMGTTFYFFCFVYLPIYFTQTLKFSIHHVSALISLLIILMIILVPLAGFICDQYGRRKLLLINSLFIFVIILPGFYFLQLNIGWILIVTMIIFTFASSSEQGTTPISIIENFPAATRYTGVSLGYNIGNGLLGGTVPIVANWLVLTTSFSLSPAIYIAICAAITGMVVYFFVPETRWKSLN